MKRLIITATLAIAAMTATARQPQPLWDTPPMDNGHDNEALITVYHPDAGSNNGRAAVICPGGAYGMLAIDHEGKMIAEWLADNGITAVVLKYRLPHGNHEIPAADAREAIRHVRRNADAWGVDSHKVGIIGSSAGGHLASTVSTHLTDSLSRPDFTVLFYPVISADPAITHAGSINNLLGDLSDDEPMLRLYSNELHVTADTPPTMLLLSDDDTVVPPANSLRYYQALKDNGVAASMYIFPIGGHGWGFHPTFTFHPQVKTLILDWFNRR